MCDFGPFRSYVDRLQPATCRRSLRHRFDVIIAIVQRLNYA